MRPPFSEAEADARKLESQLGDDKVGFCVAKIIWQQTWAHGPRGEEKVVVEDKVFVDVEPFG